MFGGLDLYRFFTACLNSFRTTLPGTVFGDNLLGIRVELYIDPLDHLELSCPQGICWSLDHLDHLDHLELSCPQVIVGQVVSRSSKSSRAKLSPSNLLVSRSSTSK